MGKKSPKAPAAPDPYAVAGAQTASNKETAIANANLNRINQYTPEGSLTYQQVGTNPDGTPQYSQTQTYSPEQQKLYESQNAVSNALSDLSLKNVGRVSDAQSQPFNYDGMTPLKTSIDQPNVALGYDSNGKPLTSFDAGGPIQKQIGDAGNIQDTYASGGDIQKGLDYSSLGKLATNEDFQAETQRTQDAVYNQAASRLDPRFEQEARKYAATLAGKGISENSQAYRTAMDNFGRTKNDAYNQAQLSSIQAGSAEQGRLFGQSLQQRQQGVGEINTQGSFANSAQAQAEAQNAARAGFGNEAQNQRFGQMQSQGNFANTAQQQQYEQNQGQADFYNSGQSQANSQNMQQAAFGNQAAGQLFGMNQANADFNNQGRQQQIQEATYLRNLPLNEVAALNGASGGVQAPQFQDYNATNVAGTDYAGIIQQGYNNQQQLYQQKLAKQNAGLGAVFGLAGSLGSAAMMSDRRLKSGVKAVGKLANGLTTYVFSYLGSAKRRFGVMADEVFKVNPEAVLVRPDGYMMVDYRKVW